MNLTKRYQLYLTPKEEGKVDEIMAECAKLWNELIQISVEYHKENNSYLTAFDLQKRVQSKYNIHSDTIGALCQRFQGNIRTTLTLKRQGYYKTKFPYKVKEKVTISGKKRQILKNNFISLFKKVRIKIDENIPLNEASSFHIKKVKSSYYLFITLEQKEQPQVKSDNMCAVDLGEVHSISSIDTNGNQYIISGRELRSYKRYRNKVHKYTKQKQKQLKEGSKLHKRLEKLREETSKKTNNKNRNILHHATDKFIEKCKENNVSEVVVGDCRTVGNSTKQNKTTNRANRQKLSQFAHGTLRFMLRYKCELNGIKFSEVEESWTTQTCPACGCLNKPKGRNYQCSSCKFVEHRDIVGSFNILRKVRDVDIGILKEKKLVGIHPLKVSRRKNSSRSTGLVPLNNSLLSVT